jgi:hypothetical protein
VSAEDKPGEQEGKRAEASGGVEREVSSLMIELAEMAQQISRQLDSRSARLEALIRAADERIERLGSMGAGTVDAGTQSQPAATNAEQQRYARIYALADEGLSADRIAQKLEMPRGEVELIVALRGGS